MQFLYKIFLLLLLFPVFSLKAQNSQLNLSSTKSIIEYQWPLNGDDNVPQRTTFIVRPSKQVMQNRSVLDFSFGVIGTISGKHSGRVLISDDEQTIIFKPDQPFELNEVVNVQFAVPGIENFIPLSYSFRITELSEDIQRKLLYQFYENEQAEYQKISESASQIQDTIAPFQGSIHLNLPLDPVIDTVTKTAAGNIFFTATKGFPSPTSYIAAIDDTGKILIDSNIAIGCGNLKMEFDGTLTFFRQYSSPKAGIFLGRYDHVDNHMNLIDTFQCVGFFCDLHDFHLMKNGHAILVAYVPRINVDMTKIPGAPPCAKTNDTVFDAVIQELDQSKNLVMQWNSKDHFAITDATSSDVDFCNTKIDYCHINAAEIDSTDGNMIASFRHMDEVTKINWKTGETIWRWGGKHNMFAFTGPKPIDTLKFSHQHDPARLANGNITLWDNGNFRPRDTMINGKDTIVNKSFSRAVEYKLDEVDHTAKVIWDDWNVPYSVAAGNVQRLVNGNTLMSMGLVGAASPTIGSPSILEVNSNNEIVFQVSFTSNSFIYRAYRFELTPSSVRQTGTANSFGLTSIYPNPAQNQTTVSFSVKDGGMMQIDVLDVLGHTVRSVREKLSGPGAYSADLDIHNLAAGTYYCKLSEGSNAVVKMIVVQK